MILLNLELYPIMIFQLMYSRGLLLLQMVIHLNLEFLCIHHLLHNRPPRLPFEGGCDKRLHQAPFPCKYRIHIKLSVIIGFPYLLSIYSGFLTLFVIK